MKCQVCDKDFISKRADAKFCSPKCRVTFNRNKVVTDKVVTDKSVTGSVTDKLSVTSRYKSPFACKIDGCCLESPPGHDDLCIYHWRKSLGMHTIKKEEYVKLNESNL